MDMVAGRPPAEQDALLSEGREVFKFRVETAREYLKDAKRKQAGFLKVATTVLGEGFIAEQIYRPGIEPEMGYLRWTVGRDEPPEFHETLDVSGLTYHPAPYLRGLVDKGALLLPSGLEEYGDEPALLDRLRTFFDKYVQLDSTVRDILAAFIPYTWIADRFETAAYCRFLGDWGAGKTTAMDVMGAVAYHGTFMAGAAKAAPIYRLLDRCFGTLILDESDFDPHDPEAKVIMKILNTG